LRLYREPRPPDGPPRLLWRAARALYAPVWRKLNALDREHARSAGKVVANSRYTAGQSESVYGREAVVVHPSVDPRFLDAEGDGAGAYVLSPGALIPQKGHGRVVRAMAGWPGAPELVVAGFRGRTGYAGSLARLAERSGVKLRIVPDPAPSDMQRLVRGSGLVVAAPFREPFGLVSLEAQASSRAVVVVEEGGLPETIVHGATGLVSSADPAPLGEAIRSLWADPSLRERMGKAGRDHVRETFSEARCGAALERALA
jgi:glycosyltransferase involved in cell wall biosynthesis